MRPKDRAGGILPSGELVIDRTVAEYEAGDYRFDGQFYQTVDEAEYTRRQAVISQHLEANTAPLLELEAYQQWVELDWKEPHGTYRAAERFANKVKEEAWFEAPEAFYDAAGWPADSELQHAALSEAGDVLWTVSALASNGGVNINQAVQSKLWGDGLLSRRVANLTLADIDALIGDEKVTPYLSAHLAAHAGDDIELIKLDEMEPRLNLLFRTASLAVTCVKQFGYGDTPFAASFYQKIGQEEVAPMVADQVLLVAWYAKHWLGSSLAEVARINALKLRSRVEAGLVDKSDGPRTEP
ncbi:MAG TPA: hypothetical protein VK712_03605 [Verrucomicrobiae bacterium]|jgi:hypothetical protein|nr:hypothetical protein [Verrucomicrobiae bacterium]